MLDSAWAGPHCRKRNWQLKADLHCSRCRLWVECRTAGDSRSFGVVTFSHRSHNESHGQVVRSSRYGDYWNGGAQVTKPLMHRNRDGVIQRQVANHRHDADHYRCPVHATPVGVVAVASREKTGSIELLASQDEVINKRDPGDTHKHHAVVRQPTHNLGQQPFGLKGEVHPRQQEECEKQFPF